MTPTIRLFRPGVVGYHEAWRWQRETAYAIRAGADEALALLQHPPVYTFGRRVRAQNLLLDAAALAQRGAALVETDRGGDVTFHGPGQLVAYPILHLRRRNLDAADYVRLLEDVMIETADGFGVQAYRWPGRPGIWVDGAKLGAIGVRVQGGVTTHGLALNVETDLAWFDAILPCGLSDVTVTSLERLLGHSPGVLAAEDALLHAFESNLESDLTPEISDNPLAPLGRGLRRGVSAAPSLEYADLVAHGH